MTLLTVGLSHRTAPVSMLERLTVEPADAAKLLEELASADSISEVLLVSTCNRVEVYADVTRFHAGVAEISGAVSRVSGVPLAELGEHLRVFFAEAAAEHALCVASGLDSMVIGESQILGQLRTAYARGVEAGTVGRELHELIQTALRVGKRVHTETGVDRAGASLVSVALDRAGSALGGLAGRDVVVVGAGSMGALAAASVRRADVGRIVMVNRSLASATRVASAVGGAAVELADRGAVRAAIAGADLVIACTGSTGTVLGPDDLAPRDGRPLVIADIALPHDVAPGVAAVPNVSYVDLEALRDAGALASDADVADAEAIVAAGLRQYLAEQQALAVAPTVTALRARAGQVIDAELRRLDTRVPELSVGERAEVADAVRRAVEKVLHAPTVRVKELAATPDGSRYAAALRALFDLDPGSAEAVVTPRALADERRADIEQPAGPIFARDILDRSDERSREQSLQ